MKHKIEIGMIFKTNSYGEIEIISRLEKGNFLVRFLSTGYECTAHRGNIVAGKVRDKLAVSPTEVVGKVVNKLLVNNAGDEFLVIEQTNNKFTIKFIETGHVMKVYCNNALAGKVKDPYKKTFLGIGYMGKPRNVPYKKKVYQLWSNMMKRCYSEADDKGYFGKAFVDPRWHCFADFLEDVPSLQNFSRWLDAENTGIKYDLDKDLKIPGNNTYSLETCSFVEESLNKGATSRNNYYR